MTKNETIEKLLVICNKKLNESIILQDNNKIEIYETIFNILKTPDFFNKQDIEITLNILNDLGITQANLLETTIKNLMQED